ncbi:MAG: hypothetical protein CVT48_06925, partial [Thermoplasmata archaeon HGW-Thermoplasmata-1]
MSRLFSDEKGVSEMVGTMLLLGIAVALFAALSLVVISALNAPNSVHANLEVADMYDRITVYHKGGEDLQADDFLIFDIDGNKITKTVGKCFSSHPEDDKNGDGKWNIGETITYDLGGNVSITVVSKETNQVILASGVFITGKIYTPPENPLTCSLSADPTYGDAPLDVTFTMSASDTDGSIASWS